MAAEGDGTSQIDCQLDRLSITSEGSSSKLSAENEPSKYDEEFLSKWGFRLRELYKLAIKFYKDKEGKAVNLSYGDKLSLLALAKQASCGKYDPSNSPSLGVLDVIGRDRRQAWQALGDMTMDAAMANYIDSLDNKCSSFRPFIEAHKADLENRRRRRMEEEKKKEADLERMKLEEAVRGRASEDRLKQEHQKRQIQEALNQQTYAQFKAYTEQQYPGDPIKQEELLKQLQEHHYQQYIEQIIKMVKQDGNEDQTQLPNGVTTVPETHDSEDDDSPGNHIITEAFMWTRKDVKEFKDAIRKEGGDSIIRVGHGETVTVRVPTNEEGTCLFWEFATDYYDIGFGVYFEWTKSITNQVSVHISESEDEDDYLNDEDDDDDDDDEEYGDGRGKYVDDIERGVKRAEHPRAPLSMIIPVCKRKCQDEVYTGSHAYPGQGVYLLKFDNSYSVLRSKTLYYRVYYTR